MKTFRLGGIHPKDNKMTRDSDIVEFGSVSRVVIGLGQHIGAPAIPIVEKGARVKVGDQIGRASGFVSANVHSSVSGVVSDVGVALDGGGMARPSITIDADGFVGGVDEFGRVNGGVDAQAEIWNEGIDRSDVLVERCDMTASQILERIAACGVVGMGGAMFPTHIKLTPPPGKTADVLIVNGVECEPYLTSDHRVMLEHAQEVVVGCAIVMRALGVSCCRIGVEDNKRDAMAMLRGAISSLGGVLAECYGADYSIEVVPLKMRYPQGGEKQLVAAITSREIPSGALPIEVGAVVQNVSTIYAIYQAVQKNKPLIDRVVTVAGDALPNGAVAAVDGGVRYANYRVRIGTPISALLSRSNLSSLLSTGRSVKIINGGPMMGRAMSNVDTAVTKGCSGIVVLGLDEREVGATRRIEAPCISCAKCVQACPLGLEPYLLCKIARHGFFDRLESERITDCIECGCCSYTCPSGLPLLDYIRLGKVETLKLIRGRK